jgi:threonyl-tRNA synthetase
VLAYKNQLHSYRELPIRLAELGTVYRYERSGALYGLMRVRGFTQDDAHIFCLPEQVTAEILGVLNLTEQILSDFGFSQYEVYLSTRPDKSVGDDAIWELATKALIEALDAKSWKAAYYSASLFVALCSEISETSISLVLWKRLIVLVTIQLYPRLIGYSSYHARVN